MDSVMEAIKGRRSVRKYKQEQISDGEVARIVEAGQLAPSGHNMQTAHFVSCSRLQSLRNCAWWFARLLPGWKRRQIRTI